MANTSTRKKHNSISKAMNTLQTNSVEKQEKQKVAFDKNTPNLQSLMRVAKKLQVDEDSNESLIVSSGCHNTRGPSEKLYLSPKGMFNTMSSLRSNTKSSTFN